jgi:uncharacterized membrane protein (DUF4010 family)
VLVIVAVVNLALLPWLALPLVLGAATQAGFAAWLAWTNSASEGEAPALELSNPFELSAVLQFGALLTIIMALARGLSTWAGGVGVYALAAVSGTVDVDAISLSMARLAPHALTALSAITAILIAVGVNSITKVGLGATAGGRRFGRLLLAPLLATLLAGGAGLWIAAQF